MKTLILMRHAKAASPAPGQRDHDRPLAPRGRRSAAALGDWLRAQGYLPQRALVSDARRTVETFEGLGLSGTALTLLPELYDAGPGDYLTALRDRTEDSLMLIGHNPAIGALAGSLLGETPVPPGLSAVPTGATFVFACDAQDWAKLSRHPIRFLDGTVPRDLAD